MTIEFQCEKCLNTLSVAGGLSGKLSRCPSCQNVQRIPDPSGDQQSIADGVPIQPPASANPFAQPIVDNPASRYPQVMQSTSKAAWAKSRVQPAAVTWLIVSMIVSFLLLLMVFGSAYDLISGNGGAN